jgi:hypothetical protein
MLGPYKKAVNGTAGQVSRIAHIARKGWEHLLRGLQVEPTPVLRGLQVEPTPVLRGLQVEPHTRIA